MRAMKTGILLLAVAASCIGAAYGCVGARPLAMGGAFIGLADDANATYWNPAGLAQLGPAEISGTWTHTSSNRDKINYQEFASMVAGLEMPRLGGRLALGGSYVRYNTVFYLGGARIEDTEDWLWASLAVNTGKNGLVGLNIRKVDDSVPGYSVKSDVGLDAGYLYRVSPRLSVGMLIQDLNTPRIKVAGFAPLRRTQNWRAGLAFRPAGDTVVTIDGYDLADNGNALSARFGVEKRLGDFALRAGFYGAGSNTDRGATFGLGIQRPGFTLDAAVLTGDFDNTVMLSGTFKVQ